MGLQIRFKTSIKVRNAKTGERREYGSLDEVPEEYRQKIKEAEQLAVSGSVGKSFTVADSTGKVQTYRSLEEMPPEARAIYERALKERK